MKTLQFDFNNMFSFSVGKKHGVTVSDLREISSKTIKAHLHLRGLLKDARQRVQLGLEWANLPFQDRSELEKIKRFGNEIAHKYENVIFLGIGGSYLGIKAAQDALCPVYYNEFSSLRRGRPRIYFEGNNLDPDTLSVLLKSLNPRKTFVVVISKSGETTETKAAFALGENWLKEGVGKDYGRQVFAITDPASGSLRKKVNRKQGEDSLSYRNLSLLPGVGGRFSEFNMGLLHLAIAGIDINEVLSGARQMSERCSSCELFHNPAYMYAALQNILYKQKGKSIAIMMPFSEGLKSTADWYVQLLAESLGKKYARKIRSSGPDREEWGIDASRILNTGRTPVSACGTSDLHSIQQNNIEGENNKAVTFIRVEKFNSDLKISGTKDFLSGKNYSQLMKLAQEATEWALVREGRPNCAIIMPEITPYSWGGLIFFFEMATAFEGELLNVNAFDQPGVEGYKNYMYYRLRRPGIPKEVSEQIRKNPLIKRRRFIL